MEIWYTIIGEVDKKTAGDAIARTNDELYSKPIERLRFLISSDGGDIGAAIGLYTYLKALPIEVETIGFGVVDAAAILVFLGGKRRLAVEGCQFFFHEGRYTMRQPTAPIHAHEEAISVFKRELYETIHIIALESGNDGEVVASMLRRSKIMLTVEAKEFGLCNDIIRKLPLEQQEKGFGFGPPKR